MSGRGDNNKQGSSGRGADSQSREAFPLNDKPKIKPANQKKYELTVDQVPYEVIAEPFTFNGELRYYISVNGSEDHIFTWDSDLKRLSAIDNEAATLPEALEQAISNRLQAGL